MREQERLLLFSRMVLLTTNDDKTNAIDNEQSATDTTGETDF